MHPQVTAMLSWISPRPSLAERFWSLAEAAERSPTVDRSGPVGVVQHILDILAELEAGRSGEMVAPTTRAFLAELAAREAAGDTAYVAPERLAGEPADEEALVYSVGVLLLEGLTGRHPLGSIDGPRRFGALAEHAMATLIARAPEIPPALRGVLGRATCADPRHRFPSVAALAAELEWFVVTEQEGALGLVPRALPLPPVMVDPRALVPSGPSPEEMELETALVPRLSFEELVPLDPRPEPSFAPPRPRRARPNRRRRRGELMRMLALAVLLTVGSAAFTAAALLLLGRR
jgi:hypothetical protein